MAKKDAEKAADGTVSSAAPKYNFDLTVIYPFLNYTTGDRITENEAIKVVVDKGYLSKCVKTARS